MCSRLGRQGQWAAKVKEPAMSQELNGAIAVIGIDIGKSSFHIVRHDHRGAIVLRQKWSWPGGNAARQPAAVPDRYGGLRRRIV
jgi:hypothetical protein